MTVYTGRRNALGIGLEASPGASTTIGMYIPFLACDLVERHTPIADTQARGIREREGPDSVEGKKWGEGSIEVILDQKTAPYWLGLALGNISTTSAGATYGYLHTITVKSDNVPLTARIWHDRSVDKLDFKNAVVSRLELNFADDIVKATADILSKYPVDGTSETPTYSNLELLTFKNAYLELTSGGATSELKVREFTLDIDNESELIYAPNSNDVDRIVNKSLNVSGSFTLLFENDTQKKAARDLTKQGLRLVLQANHTGRITIEIPRYRIDNYTPTKPIDDLVQEGVDFVAEYNGTKTISAVVDNDVASY